MPEINLSDKKGRDARVSAEGVGIVRQYRWIDEDGAQVMSRKILRSVYGHDMVALRAAFGDEEGIARALIDGDPEIDVEGFGSFLEDTSRVYVDTNHEIVHKISQWDIVCDPDGSEKERRPKRVLEQNVAAETPLKWTGKLLKKSEVFNRFVFSGKMQLGHVNGLTYDFLYTMAEDLEKSDSLLLLGGGPRGTDPLIFRRGALSYRGFLEGRTDGKRYALILHLSNMELKAPAPIEEKRDERGEEPKPAKKKYALKKSTSKKKVAAKKTAKKKAAKKKGTK